MLLKNEIETIKEKIISFGVQKIKDYSIKLKESKQYNDFETRLSFDILRAIDSNCEYINELYKKYNCNDIHIETLMRKALKELSIL